MQSVPERLESHLAPGERVLWVGSPDPKLFSWRGLAELVGPVLFITGLMMAVVVIALLASGHLQELLDDVQDWSGLERWIWISMGVSLPVSMAGATAMVVMLVSALGWAHRRRDLYAITNQGFLWQQSVWPLPQSMWPVHRFALGEVNALEVVRHADGTGTITFLDEWVALDADTHVNPSFGRIPDVDLALAIAYAAAEEAGIPQPERPTAWQVMGQAFTNWLGSSIIGAAAAIVACAGASILFGSVASGQRWDLEGIGRLALAVERAADLTAAVVLMFVTGFLGLWSLAVRSKLRRYPHLHRLRRLLAWLRVVVAVVWLGSLAWIVLTLAS